jgi:beta-lactam-binding protein with PASTA domain
MFFHFRWRCLGLALAGGIVFVVVGGCSAPVSILLPDPTVTAPAATEQPLLLGGGVSVSVSGNAVPSSAGGTASQSPVLRLLALLNRLASSSAGGCTPPGPNTVPDVTNIPLAQAQSNLLLQGLKVGNIRWAYSGTVSPGNVISQDPAAGKTVTSDTVVNLLASLGPQLAAVPDVEGRLQADAQSVITDAGFTVGTTAQTYSPTVAAGNVVSQDPAAGTLAPPAAPVNLLISQGPQPVAVPNVTGQTQANAQQAILASGLSVGAVEQGSSATVPAGSVMGQNPAAEAMVPPGTPVDLFVSQGPQPVAVPDVVGRTQSDAEATITGSGFTVGAVTQVWSASVLTGSVAGQDPAAGTVMIPGSQVGLVVSRGPQPVAVPNTVGMTQADAQAAVTAVGLTVGAVTQEYSGTVPEDTVLSQNPAAETLLPPGAPVSLVLAKKTISLCDYYPFAVGNKWVTAGTNGDNGISSEVTDAFIINGCQCWKTTAIDHSANDKTNYSYAVEANGWMYQYKVLDDLFLLPGIAPSAQKVAPMTVTPGESFVATFNGTSLAVTPAVGRLSDFVPDTSACPFGDVGDTVALKLGNLTLMVFGRDLGPLYYNYITRSGFYSSITIVGGCGVARP